MVYFEYAKVKALIALAPNISESTSHALFGTFDQSIAGGMWQTLRRPYQITQ